MNGTALGTKKIFYQYLLNDSVKILNVKPVSGHPSEVIKLKILLYYIYKVFFPPSLFFLFQLTSKYVSDLVNLQCDPF